MAANPYEKLNDFLKKQFRENFVKKLDAFFYDTEEYFQRNGFREKIPSAVENILVLRLDAIGDFILTSGFIRELRKNFPKANITLIVSPTIYPLAELCPYVNEVLKFENSHGLLTPKIFERILNFCREKLWVKHFSHAFLPQWGSDNVTSLFLAYLCGAQERIGYGTYPYRAFIKIPDNDERRTKIVMDNLLLTKNIISPKELVTEAEKHFYVLTAAGLKIENDNMELWFGTKDFLRAKKFLKDFAESDKKIVLGLGAGQENRKYPVEKLCVALKEIAEKNFSFIAIGGEAERKAVQYVEKNLPKGKVLNLVGKMTLREVAAVISQADFYLGNDTGVMHMSAAAGVPILAIYKEAIDKENDVPGVYSEFRRFFLYQATAIILRPAHALDDCQNVTIHGGCSHSEPHCITQIEPQKIVASFWKLEEFVAQLEKL